jgi:hypothetical protein
MCQISKMFSVDLIFEQLCNFHELGGKRHIKIDS